MKIVQTIQGGEAVMLTDHQRAMADLELQHKSAMATLQRKYDQLYESWRLLQPPGRLKAMESVRNAERELQAFELKAFNEPRRYTGLNGDVLEVGTTIKDERIRYRGVAADPLFEFTRCATCGGSGFLPKAGSLFDVYACRECKGRGLL